MSNMTTLKTTYIKVIKVMSLDITLITAILGTDLDFIAIWMKTYLVKIIAVSHSSFNYMAK